MALLPTQDTTGSWRAVCGRRADERAGFSTTPYRRDNQTGSQALWHSVTCYLFPSLTVFCLSLVFVEHFIPLLDFTRRFRQDNDCSCGEVITLAILQGEAMQERQPAAARTKTPPRRDAYLLSLPEGIQVQREGTIRYYWYNTITDTSRRRLWNLMDQCLQVVSNPDKHIWQARR